MYRAALNEQPEFPEALLNLGHVLKALGREIRRIVLDTRD